MADPTEAAAASRRQEELQKQLQTLQVLESELKTLPSDAKVYNAIATPLEAPLIAHAHGQHAFFPNLDAKTSLQDVQRQKRVLLANLGQLNE